MTRDDLLTALREKFPLAWFRPGEAFNERYTDMIWTGKGSYIKYQRQDHTSMCNFFDLDGPFSIYTPCGIHCELQTFLTSVHWQAFSFDPDNYFIIPKTFAIMTGRDKLMQALKEKFPLAWFKPGEEFLEAYRGGIWSGEGSYVRYRLDGNPDETFELDLFDPYGIPSSYAESGAHNELEKMIRLAGWRVLSYDPCTFFIIPEKSN